MRKIGQSGWEDNERSLNQIEDIESAPEKTTVTNVSGEELDEDYMWRRPQEDQAGEHKVLDKTPGPDDYLSDLYRKDEEGLTSSERLYRMAQASRGRGNTPENKAESAEETEFFYKKKTDPKPIILRLAITLALSAVAFGLFLAIQKELKIREDLKNTKPSGASALVIEGSESEGSKADEPSDQIGVGEDSSKTPEETVEVQIVGNWFDRYEEIQDFFDDETDPKETEETRPSQN